MSYVFPIRIKTALKSLNFIAVASVVLLFASRC